MFWVEELEKEGKLKEKLNELIKIQNTKIIVFANRKDKCDYVNIFFNIYLFNKN